MIQAKTAFVKQMRSASPYVRRMSLREFMVKGRGTKMSLHKDKKWHVSMTPKKYV